VIKFRLNMVPRGQMRVRARAFKVGERIQTSVYKAGKDRKHEETIASLAAPYCPAQPIDYPVRLDVVVVTPRPASMTRISKRDGQPLGDTERAWHTGKPDADNFAKAVLDALQAFWLDDKLVVELHVVKVIAEWRETPGFEITIDRAGIVPGTQLDKAVTLADAVM